MKRILLSLSVLPLFLLAKPKVGEALPHLVLKGEQGVMVSGGSWDSASLEGKVRVVFYVDPGEKDLNEHVGEAIKKENFKTDFYGSVAIINMAASRMPNFVLNKVLKGKQKKYKRTTYVKDFQKVLVKKWGLADDSYDCLVLAPDGKVLFYGSGRLSDKQLKEMLEILRQAIAVAGKKK